MSSHYFNNRQIWIPGAYSKDSSSGSGGSSSSSTTPPPTPVPAPILTSISLNSGAASTYERDIIVNFTLTGEITHYRIGEVADLSNVAWITGTGKSQRFALSTGFGNKTVYVQVKNSTGGSEVKSAIIELAERPVVKYKVTGVANNAAYGTVTPTTQDVVEGGTANLTAQANQGYVIESWAGVSTATGVDTGTGTATVANVRANKTVTCNFKQDPSIPVGNAKMKLSLGESVENNFDTASGINRVQSTTSVKNLLDTNGNAFGTVQAKKAVLTTNIYGKKTGDNSGIVPDFCADTVIYIRYLASEPIQMNYLFTVPNGRYKVGVMANVASDCPWATAGSIATDLSKTVVLVNSNLIRLTAMMDNTSVIDYSAEFDVTDGQITITGEYQTIRSKAVAFTYLEIERIVNSGGNGGGTGENDRPVIE